jgi:hypothetical protein
MPHNRRKKRLKNAGMVPDVYIGMQQCYKLVILDHVEIDHLQNKRDYDLDIR